MTTWGDPIPSRVLAGLQRIVAVEPSGDSPRLDVTDWARALDEVQRIAQDMHDELSCQVGEPDRPIVDRHGRRAPLRVDTFRSQVAAAAELLRLVGEHLDDLHVLAYDRPKAAEVQRVAGGSRDYALDTHGSAAARDLWREAAAAVIDTTEDLAEVCHRVLTWLRTGDRPTERRDRSADVTLAELSAAIDAQKRRRARGDYSPVASEQQPATTRVPDPLAELEALQEAVRRTVDESESGPDPLVKKIKNPKGGRIRPASWRLTPRQLEAWKRAIAPLDDARAKAKTRRGSTT